MQQMMQDSEANVISDGHLWELKNKARQDFHITPYINYAYIHCLKKTKDRTILSLWDFSCCFSADLHGYCLLKQKKGTVICGN